MRGGGLAVAAITAFVLGVALLVPFETVLTRVAGVLALLAYIVFGVFAIASPDRLRGTEDRGAEPGQGDAA